MNVCKTKFCMPKAQLNSTVMVSQCRFQQTISCVVYPQSGHIGILLIIFHLVLHCHLSKIIYLLKSQIGAQLKITRILISR